MYVHITTLLATAMLICIAFLYHNTQPCLECRCLVPECPQVVVDKHITVIAEPVATAVIAPSEEITEMVMMVPIPAAWKERQERVAKAFLLQKFERKQAIMVFVMGTRLGTNLETENIDALSIERIAGVNYCMVACRDHGENFNSDDNTASMACKVYEGFKYIASNYKARYVWRSDSDSYLNIKLFLNTMAPTLPTSRLFMGRLRRPTLADTDLLLAPQPVLHGLFGLYQFGHYMSGMGFMLTWDVIEFIASMSIPPRMNWCDDVLVSMWLMPLQIQFVDVNSMQDYVMFGSEERAHYAHTRKNVLLVHYMRQHDWENIDPVTGVLRFYD